MFFFSFFTSFRRLINRKRLEQTSVQNNANMADQCTNEIYIGRGYNNRNAEPYHQIIKMEDRVSASDPTIIK